MAYIENVKTSSDLKKLNIKETALLAEEIRNEVIDTVSKNGGHLASNLGVVELTLALHRVFDFPTDSVVFDVGHQCYIHKLLTGRREVFNTLRKKDGISGFTNRFESEYDIFGAGHSGTSVSAALGIAAANKLKGNNAYSIAVVGDGSLTNGMVYEALNNCSSDTPNVIIVLNDNEMSISKNVGAMSSYLSEVSNSRGYINFKNKVYALCLKMRGLGNGFLFIGRFVKNSVKKLFMNKNYFECLGLKYFGPIDGHDQELLELVFEQAKKKKRPCLVHIVTQKGKGYAPAEERADAFHSVGPFDKESGVTQEPKYDYSAKFGDSLVELARENKDVVAVTAAMENGTGLANFNKEFPDRFFDVGIAEEHAVTFCAGMAARGKKPIFAVYSSFLQRSYDQIIHDVAIQKLPVCIAIDRAGLVAGDGMTHQGIYDSSFLNSIPEIEVYSPENYNDITTALKRCIKCNSPTALRYPKGCENMYDEYPFEEMGELSCATVGSGQKRVALITYGKVTYNAYQAAKELCKNDDYAIKVIKLLKIKPIDAEFIYKLCDGYDKLLFIEEGVKNGGVGEILASEFALRERKLNIHAIDNFTNFSGDIDELYDKFGFTSEKIIEKIKNI